jgi:hypothetical protein
VHAELRGRRREYGGGQRPAFKGRGDMKGRRFAVLIGLCVAAVGTTAFASGAAAGPAPVRSQTAVWANTSGVQQHVPAAASKEIRALVQQAARALQARSDDDNNGKNTVYCPGATPPIVDEPGEQSCTFTGSKGTCIQKSTNPDTTQLCKFSQGPTPGKSNLAIALQIIVQKESTTTGQNGRQIVKVSQRNTTKPNSAYVAQFLKQSLGPGAEDADDDEIEDGAAIQQKAELQGSLPDFAPLIATLQSTEPATEGDDPVTLAVLGPGDSDPTESADGQNLSGRYGLSQPGRDDVQQPLECVPVPEAAGEGPPRDDD